MNFENLVDLTMKIFAERDHKTQSVNHQLDDRGRLGTEVAADFKKFHFKNRQYICMTQKANKQQKVMLLITTPSQTRQLFLLVSLCKCKQIQRYIHSPFFTNKVILKLNCI